jgi:hypothetical protein
MLLMCFLNDIGKLLQLILNLSILKLRVFIFLLLILILDVQIIFLLFSNVQVVMLIDQGLILRFYLVLKLGDLMGGYLELSFKLSDFVLGFD